MFGRQSFPRSRSITGRCRLRIVDNGHTIQVNYDPGSSLMVGGKRYELVQFHFHRPSEEVVDGKRSAMVAHLVHRDAKAISRGRRAAQGGSGK